VKPGSWHGTILNLTGRKFPENFRQRKLMIAVFWDCEGVTLLDSLPRGETVNSDAYSRMLTELWKLVKRV
jgi:hypothetical protein